MSAEEQVGAGWYPDVTNPGHERLWTGDRWLGHIRPNRVGEGEANPAGWRPDPGHPGFERLWTGEMWTDEIRRAAPAPDASAEVAAPEPAMAMAGAAAPGAPPSLASASVGPPPIGTVTADPGFVPPQVSGAHAIYHDAAPPDRLVKLGNWVRIVLATLIAVDTVELFANWRYINTESHIIHGPLPTISQYETTVSTVRSISLIGLCTYFAAAILFVIWFYRAYRNLVRAGIGDLRYSPGWALGAWFIPFFNLVRPKQIANDIWKASEGVATVGARARHTVPLPAALNWWWGLWIFSGIATTIGNLTITHARDGQVVDVSGLRDTRTGLWLDQLGLVAAIVALVMLINLVRDISRRQDEHFRAPAGSWPSR